MTDRNQAITGGYMASTSNVLMEHKDLADFYKSVNGLRSELPAMEISHTHSDDISSVISNLKNASDNIAALTLLFNYYSITENQNGIKEIIPLLQKQAQLAKKTGLFNYLQGTHALRSGLFKEAIKFFEQALLHESNQLQRQEIFYRIAYSLFKLGSLQALHYISIIKTTDTDLLGRIALLEGLVYFEILKNQDKTNLCFKRSLEAFRSVENRYYEHIVLQHLSELYEAQGLSDQSSRYKKEVESFLNSLVEKTKPKEIKETKREIKPEPTALEQLPLEFNTVFSSLGKLSLQELEKRYMLYVLEQSQSLDEACKTLDVDRKTLYNKRKAWNLL